MWKVTVKGLLAHKLRLALTALAIVLGVTFISGTLVLTDTLHNTFTTLFGHVYQNVDFEVRGKAAFNQNSATGGVGRKPIPESIVTTVRHVPGVGLRRGDRHRATPSSWPPTARPSAPAGPRPSGSPSIPTPSCRLAHTWPPGRAPTTPDEVVMDEGTAQKYHFTVGDRVRVLLAGPPQTFTISGIVKFGTADNLAGATLAAFDLPTAQQLFDEVGQYDAIDVLAKPGADKATVQQAIARVLPPGCEVVTGQTVANEQTTSINQALGFFSTALLVFAFISLFVGGFTIFNTFSIIVGQRTRELALLRIVGASRRQVFRSVLIEAAIVGLVASLVGLGLGVLAALGLEALLKGFGITLPSGPLVFEARTVIAALVVGVGVTVVSAISPARRAVRIPPVAALADYRGEQEESSRRRIVVGTHHRRARRRRPGRGADHARPSSWSGWARSPSSSASACWPPWWPDPCRACSGVRWPRLLGISGQVGPRELDAQPAPHGPDLVRPDGRAGPGVHHRRLRRLAVQVGHQQRRPGGQRQLHHHHRRATGNGRVLATRWPTAAGRVPGVTAVSTVYSGEFEFQQLVVQPDRRLHRPSGPDGHPAHGGRIGGAGPGRRPAAHRHHHGQHQAPVGGVEWCRSRFAETGQLHHADRRHLQAQRAARQLRGRRRLLPLPLRQSAAGGRPPPHRSRPPPAVGHGRRHAASRPYPNLKIQTRAQFEKSQQKQVNQLLGLVYALLALAVVIALIGIVNTLMLSVFERTHEIGLLRAVGMKRRQVRAMIRSEAVILSVFGAIIGVVVGTALGIAFAASLKQQGITDIVVPVASLIVFLVIVGAPRAGRRLAGRPAGRPSSTCWRPSPPTDHRPPPTGGSGGGSGRRRPVRRSRAHGRWAASWSRSHVLRSSPPP